MQTGNADGTYLEHLEELRWALIRAVAAIILLFPFALYFSDGIIQLLIARLCPPEVSLKYFSPVEPFLVKLKMALFIAIFLALPVIFKQFWSFVAPGLYQWEKRLAAGLLVSTFLLSFAGAAFALILIMPLIMSFSLSFETSYLQASIGIDNFVSLTGSLMIAFAAVFQMPAVILVMVITGMVSMSALKASRAYVLVVILIVSAVLTPPDVVSQLMMTLPAYLLFEAGLLFASFFTTRPTGKDNGMVEKKVDKDY